MFTLPALVLAAPLLLLDVAPTSGATTGATTGASSGSGSSGATGETGATSETMPPVYHACGCTGAGEGGAWGLLALVLTAAAPSRRRRPTTRRPCCRAG